MLGELHCIRLSAGCIEYRDTGGHGPVLLFVHGLLMDRALWDEVVVDLGGDHRCIVPTLPLGAHRIALGAELSLKLVSGLVGELIDALELADVTVVGNDTGGAIVQLLAADAHPQVRRIALVSCDAFDNYPPGLTGAVLVAMGKLPPRLFGLAMQQMRLKLLRRLPIAFGWLTKRGDAYTRSWLVPLLTQPEIRQDAVKLLRSIPAEPDLLTETAERLRTFEGPSLVVWAAEDRVMPPEHGRRLAELLPHARHVEISDSYTLVPLDQPLALAAAIRTFVASAKSHTTHGRRGAGLCAQKQPTSRSPERIDQ